MYIKKSPVVFFFLKENFVFQDRKLIQYVMWWPDDHQNSFWKHLSTLKKKKPLQKIHLNKRRNTNLLYLNMIFFLCIHTGAADPHACVMLWAPLVIWNIEQTKLKSLILCLRAVFSLYDSSMFRANRHLSCLTDESLTSHYGFTYDRLHSPFALCLHMEVVWHSLLEWMPSGCDWYLTFERER